MRIQHLQFYCPEQKGGGGGIRRVVQDDVCENELGFIFRGLVWSRFRAAEEAVRLALVPTQAVWLMPSEYSRNYFYKEEGGGGDGEGGEYNKPFVQDEASTGHAEEEMGKERRIEGVMGAHLRPFNIPLYPFACVQATQQTAREHN